MSNHRKTLVLLAAGTALTLSSPWLRAAENTPSGATGGMSSSSADASFNQHDANHDGSISKSEAKGAGIDESRFDQYDANHDGKLSMSEWQAMVAASGAPAGHTAMGSTPPPSAQAGAANPPPTGASGMQGGTKPAQANAILNMTPDQLKGKHIVNAQGKKIGEIDRVVKAQTGNDLYAVVTAGGFLGIGGKKVVVPIRELQMSGDRFTITGIGDENQLKQQQRYQHKNYADVQGDQVLANIAKGSAGKQASATGEFKGLDANHDSYIEPDEAQKNPRLAQDWQKYDKNHDGKLDQNEFSAFESAEGKSSGMSRDSDEARERQGRDGER